MVGRRKLPDTSLNRIFHALSIGVQCMLSFQFTNIGIKWLHYANKQTNKQKKQLEHPSSLKNSISYCQTFRVKSVCSTADAYEKKCAIIKKNF